MIISLKEKFELCQIKKIYSGYKVETINLSEIIELGGALHCITAEKFGQ